jgi:hypothetical protein
LVIGGEKTKDRRQMTEDGRVEGGKIEDKITVTFVIFLPGNLFTKKGTKKFIPAALENHGNPLIL